VIWTPEAGELVLLVAPGEVGLGGADTPAASMRHDGQVGLVVGWAGNGLLEVLWPDGTLTGVWASLGRLQPAREL
jgi:hypothetical protein